MSITTDLILMYVGDFHKDNLGFLKGLANAKVAKMVFLHNYSILCKYNKVIPIENLKELERSNMWETAKEYADGRLNKEELIDFCRCLYCLEYFLNQ